MLCTGLTEAEREQYEEDVLRWQKMEDTYEQKKLAMATRRKGNKERYESGRNNYLQSLPILE